MAYISTGKVKEIRNELKATFPSIKFSVRREDYLSVSVSIMASDIDFSDILQGSTYTGINHYWIKQNYPAHAELLTQIFEIINKGNHDNSDIMTDYFDVGWYVHFGIGQWNKPYVYRGTADLAGVQA